MSSALNKNPPNTVPEPTVCYIRVSSEKTHIDIVLYHEAPTSKDCGTVQFLRRKGNELLHSSHLQYVVLAFPFGKYWEQLGHIFFVFVCDNGKQTRLKFQICF